MQNLRIGFVSTILPRHCGIATFTDALVRNLPASLEDRRVIADLVAISSQAGEFHYPPAVGWEITQRDFDSYADAAAYLNRNADAVIIQHEYGIFGGRDGDYVLALAGALQVPLITTLHTVLRDPGETRLTVLRGLAERSDALTVMTRDARAILQAQLPAARIEVIPHGVPTVAPRLRDSSRVHSILPGGEVLLTAGFLGPGKGIESTLHALVSVVADHPSLVYVVLGQTHPEERRRNGEAYREALGRTIAGLGLQDHVEFIDEFVTEDALIDYLARADVYVSPYESREQSSSGMLSYAAACGNAIISTSYPFARELLADDAGIVVPHGDDEALARAISSLLADPVLRHELGERMYARARWMTWPRVALRYAALAAEFAPEVPRRTDTLPSPAVARSR